MRGRSQAAKQEMDSVMHQVLGLPPSMLLRHMANANQSAGNFNAALGQFLTIGDAGSALQIFSGHLCPLYFGSPDLVNSLKIQRVPYDTRSGGRAAAVGEQEAPSPTPDGFRKSGQRKYVDSLLRRLQQAAEHTQHPPLGQAGHTELTKILSEALQAQDSCQVLLHSEDKPEPAKVQQSLGAITALVRRAEQATPGLESTSLVYRALIEALHHLQDEVRDNSRCGEGRAGGSSPLQMPSFLAGGLRVHRCGDLDDAAPAEPSRLFALDQVMNS